MASGDIDIGKLLKDIDNLLASVDVNSKRQIFSQQNPGGGAEERNPEDDLISDVEPSKDGYADIFISEDGMTAYADFFPPGGAGLPLTLEAFQTALQEKDIVWGVQWPFIRDALFQCNTGLKTVRDVAVAQGLQPEDYLPVRWEIKQELMEEKKMLDEKAIFLDFKSVSPFTMVKKGDLLAPILPEREGSFGYDIFGKALPYSKQALDCPVPGENVVESPQGYRASCDGRFIVDLDGFRVEQVLELKTGVSYETGNIDFPGDVIIGGEIARGFKIHANGSIFCRQVIDATELVAKGDIVTPMGIIGRPGSVVRAEGRIRAKFLENCYILARESVEINTSVMNSSIQTLDRLVLGDKGLLMGGKIQAQNGVDAYQIGSERGSKAEIICGMDFSALERIIWIRDQNMLMVKQLKMIEYQITQRPSHTAELKEAYNKIREEMRKLNELSKELLLQIDKNDGAEVNVRGTIFPGNYLEICHISFIVSKPMSRVRFFLDKKKGQIGFRPL